MEVIDLRPGDAFKGDPGRLVIAVTPEAVTVLEGGRFSSYVVNFYQEHDGHVRIDIDSWSAQEHSFTTNAHR